MLLYKVKKKDRKQLLLILYTLPWSFPENDLTLPWENLSDWNFTQVFSKSSASGRYLRGLNPVWVAECLQLSQSLQVPWLALQALGLPFTLSTLNLFMCNSSGKAFTKLIWSSIIEWYTFSWFWSGIQHFHQYWEIGLHLGPFQDSERKMRESDAFSLQLLPQRWKYTCPFDWAFESQILLIFPYYPYLREDCLDILATNKITQQVNYITEQFSSIELSCLSTYWNNSEECLFVTAVTNLGAMGSFDRIRNAQ